MIRNLSKKWIWNHLRCGFQQASNVTTLSSAATKEEALPFSELPRIPTVPFIGSSWIYLPLIGKYDFWKMHKANLQKYYDYGPIFLETFSNDFEMVYIYNPEDYAKMYRNEGRFPERFTLQSLTKYRETKKDLYNNGGILTTKGKEWWEVRSQTQPHMMKPKAIHAYIGSMDEVAIAFRNRMVSLRQTNSEVPDYMDELNKWSLESVFMVAFDARLGGLEPNPNEESVQIIKTVGEMFALMMKLEFGALNFWRKFPSPTYRKFEKNMDFISKKALTFIAEAKKRLQNAPEGHDLTFLELMLSTTKDPRDINAMLSDMIFAGVDTTSSTTGYALYHLARNPEAQEKAYQEIKSNLKDGRITPETLNHLSYLKACVKESMRLNPVAIGHSRILSDDTVMSGYNIPAGTLVFGQQYVIGQMEKYYPEPTTFRPERFLRNQSDHDPFAYLPFGFGTRSCIGRRIAEQEIWILLIRLLEKFRVEYNFEDIDMHTRLVAVPDKPLRFQFYDR